MEKRKISTIGFTKDKWLKKYAKGFLLRILMMGEVVLILAILGVVEVEKKSIQPVGVLFILIAWTVQGSTEEIVTRVWFMNVIGARYNATFGLILSSVIFGFEVSGINVGVSSLGDLNLVGNNVINGGVFGPEAGLVATVVLLANVVIFLKLDKKGVI